jgi:outer membrane protease
MVAIHSLFAASAVALSAVLASAADAGELGGQFFESNSGMMTLTGGMGIVALQGDEFVYAAPGSNNAISHLIWGSLSPIVTTELRLQMPEDWTISAKADIGASGIGNMDDYDWVGPDFKSYNPDDWTHHSLSANAPDWYFNGQVLVGRDLHINEANTVNFNAGLSYTDLRWTATGGSYTYSRLQSGDPCSFRTCTGTFANIPVLTYRQQFPALIAGMDFKTQQGSWTLGGSAHGGMTFSAVTTDDHWLRSRTVVDTLAIAPVVSIAADAKYKVSNETDIVLSAELSKIFVGRGNASYTYHDGSNPDFSLIDQNGDGLVSATMTAGLRGHF